MTRYPNDLVLNQADVDRYVSASWPLIFKQLERNYR